MSRNCTEVPDELQALDPAHNVARQYLYRFFALLVSDPRSRRWQDLTDARFADAATFAADLLRDDFSDRAHALAPGEMPVSSLDVRTVLSLLPASAAQALQGYQQIFGLMAPNRTCPPYETEYCSHRDPYYRAHQMADVSGFYRAFGLQPSRDVPERHDHAALELEFMSWIIAREQHARDGGAEPNARICLEAQHKFLRDHLSWWMPTFAFALRREADGVGDADELASTPQSFYGAVAASLAAFISTERLLLHVAAPKELLSPRAADEIDDACAACCGAAAVAPQA